MMGSSRLARPVRLPGAGLALLACVAVLALGGCDFLGDTFGKKDTEEVLPGERIAVLQDLGTIEPDAGLTGQPIQLPPVRLNQDWTQSGGRADHEMGHLDLSPSPGEVWSVSAGAASSDGQWVLSPPIVADGRVYVLDAETELHAIDAVDGERLWSRELAPETATGDAPGGGVAYLDGRLYVSTGFAEILALDAATGETLWRTDVPTPPRGAPTVIPGRLFVILSDSRTVCLATEDGTDLWEHTGLLEVAGLLGNSSPAANDQFVVTAYPSGDIHALRVTNGVSVWSDSLAAIRRAGIMDSLSDIRALPVMAQGLTFAISNSGRMVVVESRSGARAWEEPIGGSNTPWPAGDHTFVLDKEGRLLALRTGTGGVRWVSALPRWLDPEDEEGRIVWQGPVLAGERLWVTGSNEELQARSPYTGELVDFYDLPDAAYLPPVVADRRLYVLTIDGTLTAFQ